MTLASRAPGSIMRIGAGSGRERMSATATAGSVRVLEREARSLHGRHVAAGDVVQVLRANRIAEQLEPVLLYDEVIVRRLILDEEAVFESAATAGLNAHAKAADVRRHALGVHETLDLVGRAGSYNDGDFGLLKGAHCCVLAKGRP